MPLIKVTGALEGDYVVLTNRAGGVLRIVPMPTDGLPVVTSLKMTCLAVPSQWEGELNDGRSLYGRYRHGLLRVGIGEDAKAAHTNSFPETAFYCEHIGDGLDGVMSSEELREHLCGLLEFADGLVVEGDPEWS